MKGGDGVGTGRGRRGREGNEKGEEGEGEFEREQDGWVG